MWPILAGVGGSILGGLLGKKQNPTIDPRVLAQLFGPGALSKDTQQLYALLANSPEFSQLMSQAGMQGANLQNQMGAQIGQSGLSASPYSGFLKAAGRGYGGTLQRGAKSDLFMKALQAAFEGLQSRQNAYVQSRLSRQEQPTWQRMIGASLLNAGSQGLSGMFK